VVVDGRGWVADHDVQAFLDKGFTRRHVLDVLTGVAMKTLSNYTNHSAKTRSTTRSHPSRGPTTASAQ
jgi:alkylhydroperoxidase family enzyme